MIPPSRRKPHGFRSGPAVNPVNTSRGTPAMNPADSPKRGTPAVDPASGAKANTPNPSKGPAQSYTNFYNGASKTPTQSKVISQTNDDDENPRTSALRRRLKKMKKG